MRDRSDRSAVQVALWLAAGLIAFAGLVEGVASWLRAVSAPEVTGANAVNTDPTFSWKLLPKVVEARARQIAIEEVKKREGWFGKVTAADREGWQWFITVGREPDVSHDYRIVSIDGDSGTVSNYRRSDAKSP